jgi:hypothetical protein
MGGRMVLRMAMTDSEATEAGATHYGSYCGLPVYVTSDGGHFFGKTWLIDLLTDALRELAGVAGLEVRPRIFNKIGVRTE